jgi:hypothetical protein
VHLRADQFAGMTVQEIEHLLHSYGVTADVRLDDALPDVGPGRRVVRSDLVETTFTRPLSFRRSSEEAS